MSLELNRELEQSLLVPVVMLCLLHARDIQLGNAPLVVAAEALTDFSIHAIDLNHWYSTADQCDAKRAAERAIASFAALLPNRLTIVRRDLA